MPGRIDYTFLMTTAPIALTIAGSDCSGGAGLQADLKTFQHFGVFGTSAVTCVVAETPSEVRSIHPIPPANVLDQLILLFENYPIAAIKTGMLYSAEIMAGVLDILSENPQIPVVIDPVMLASTGDSLTDSQSRESFNEALLRRATLITPNLDEAETLGQTRLTDETSQAAAARELSAKFGTGILLKGGHLHTAECRDIYQNGTERSDFVATRIDTPASHGTGCTLSAAITAGLALGKPMIEAIGDAKTFLNQSLAQSLSLGSQAALNQGTRLPD